MQKVVREKQEMMYSMGNLQRIELENHQLKHQNMDQSGKRIIFFNFFSEVN